MIGAGNTCATNMAAEGVVRRETPRHVERIGGA